MILNDVYLGDNTHIENCIVESRDTIRANSYYSGEEGEVKIVVEKKRTLRIINAEDQISADTVSEMKGASSNEYYRCTCEEGSERRENEGRCVCHNR